MSARRTGRTPLDKEMSMGFGAQNRDEDTCVRCNGTGKNSGGRRCGRCGGDGSQPDDTSAIVSRLRDERDRLRAENDRLREAAALVVARCEEATRIIGLRDFRDVRLYDSEWKFIKAALGGSQAKGSEVARSCPTCGESGPDVIDRVGDYGGDTFEARCGDEWHDGQAKGSE